MAIASERVAAPGTVAGLAAASTEAPVSGQAAVTAWPCHTRLAGAVTGAGVTEGAGAQGERGRSQRVAGAGCEDTMVLVIRQQQLAGQLEVEHPAPDGHLIKGVQKAHLLKPLFQNVKADNIARHHWAM